MKKLIPILFFILLLAINCNKKSSNHSIRGDNDTLKMNVDNFLKGNRYFYSLSFDENNQLNASLEYTEQEEYGRFISFTDSLHYEIYESILCNALTYCFFYSSGKYYLPTNDDIVMVLDSTTYIGPCDNKPTIYGNGEKQTYKIIRTNNDSIIQIKRSTKVDDLNYATSPLGDINILTNVNAKTP